MKMNKKMFFYGTVFLVFIVYLLYANDIFNILIKTEKEADIANVTLPAETNNIVAAIDEAGEVKLKWKKALYIKGWVFRKDVKRNQRTVQFVLKSEKKTLVFNIKNDMISRQDVTNGFNLDKNVYKHGFELYIPLYRLKEAFYQIGFIITDETGKSYSDTKKAINITNNSINIIDLGSEKISNLVSLKLKDTGKEISYYFDKAAKTGRFFNIIGWGFFRGLNTNSQESYILLKNEEKVLVFDTKMQIRKDITTGFSKYEQNLDSSGFISQIPLGKLEKGRYKIGLYLVKEGQGGIVYSDKYIMVEK